jgi:pimeloyl-ACP methyl ester carboxylesterase
MIGRLLLILMVGGAAFAASDPSVDGAFASTRQTVDIPGTQNATLATDVYFPGTTATGVDRAAGPCPVIVLGHGFAQSRNQHVNQGLQLATRGYLVLIPSFNGGSDHARNGQDLSKCVDWILARNKDPASIFLGQVRTQAVGVTGHSAGGLSAILAAAADLRIRALSLMDSVDSGGQGVAALAAVTVPVAITWSEPSSCNASGSAEVLYAAARGVRRGLKIVGANHTDPQDPASFLSVITCGGANSTRQALYRRYMAGWFEYHLRGDASYAPWILNFPGGQLAADLAANRITYQAVVPLGLGLGLTNGVLALEVSGPSGQRFALERSMAGGPWTPAATNTTPAAPVVLPLSPALDLELLRTQSLP